MKKAAIYVTKKGYNQYLKLLKDYEKNYEDFLKTRPDYGKNSNDDYKTRVYDEERTALMYQINSLKETISRLEIIKDTKADENKVNIDDIVNISIDGETEFGRVQIVGGMPEIDREDGLICITINSPLGSALYKKNIGETATYKVNNNEFKVTILSKEQALTNADDEPKA